MGECAVARSNGKCWSRVESYALEDQLLIVERVLLVGADMAEKHSLCFYVSVFQSVVKVGRLSAYRCSVHAAAHLRKVMRKRPEIAHLRKVERASVRCELRYSASEAYVWKSHLRKVSTHASRLSIRPPRSHAALSQPADSHRLEEHPCALVCSEIAPRHLRALKCFDYRIVIWDPVQTIQFRSCFSSQKCIPLPLPPSEGGTKMRGNDSPSEGEHGMVDGEMRLQATLGAVRLLS